MALNASEWLATHLLVLNLGDYLVFTSGSGRKLHLWLFYRYISG